MMATLGTTSEGQTVRLPNGMPARVLYAHAVHGAAWIVFEISDGRRGKLQGPREREIEILETIIE